MYVDRPEYGKLINLIEKSGFINKNQKSDLIIRNIILNVLTKIGLSYSRALIHHTCDLYGLSQNELLADYDLFEKSLIKILGKAGFPILLRIKKELLKYIVINKIDISVADILDPSFNIPKIINKLVENDIYKILSDKLNDSNHIMVLSKNEENIGKLIDFIEKKDMTIEKNKIRIVINFSQKFENKRFFNTESDTRIYTNKNWDLNDPSLSQINLIGKMFENHYFRIFSFFNDVNLFDETKKKEFVNVVENKLRNVCEFNNHVQIFCIYNPETSFTNKSEINLLEELKKHNIVILDEPFSIYEKYDHEIKRF